MIDLKTKYMGLELKNPLVPSASTLTINFDECKRLEDNGAAALVMHSLFEEQLDQEAMALEHYLRQGEQSYAEALNYLPEPDNFYDIAGEAYLELIAKLKKSLDIPIIASLNGASSGGWMDYSRKMQEAGADAVELNIYYIPTDPKISAEEVEKGYIEDIKRVKSSLDIPVAVKANPYFSAFANMAHKMQDAGADALVLFNRFYQPDINIVERELAPTIEFSKPYELRLPLRWVAILRSQLDISLAASSGIHTYQDVIKALLAGADITMMASVLFEKGTKQIGTILRNTEEWLKEHEYESVAQLKGSMSYKSVKDPAAYERANYMKVIQSIKHPK